MIRFLTVVALLLCVSHPTLAQKTDVVIVPVFDDGGPDFSCVLIEEENAPGWEMRHDMTAEELKAKSDKVSANGYLISSVSGYTDGNRTLFAAIWVKGGVPRGAYWGLTSKALSDKIEEVKTKGFAPTSIDVYGKGLNQRYTLMYEKHDRGWKTLSRKSEDHSAASRLVIDDGFRPLCVNTYLGRDNSWRVYSVWINDGQWGTFGNSMDVNKFRSSFEDLEQKKARLVWLKREGDRYDGVWSDSHANVRRTGYVCASRSKFQGYFNDFKNRGYRPLSIVVN